MSFTYNFNKYLKYTTIERHPKEQILVNNNTLFNEGNIIHWLPSSVQYGPP